jgi:hypothetical protein
MVSESYLSEDVNWGTVRTTSAPAEFGEELSIEPSSSLEHEDQAVQDNEEESEG